MPALYYESSAVLITFILLGKWLETRALGQTAAALRALAGCAPTPPGCAGGTEEQTSRSPRWWSATWCAVRPGERIPVDGARARRRRRRR